MIRFYKLIVKYINLIFSSFSSLRFTNITNNQKTLKNDADIVEFGIIYTLKVYFSQTFLRSIDIEFETIEYNVLSINDIPLCCLFYFFMIGKTKHLLLTFSEHSRDSRRYGNILKRKKNIYWFLCDIKIFMIA